VSDLLSRFRFPLTYLVLALLCLLSMSSRREPSELNIGSQALLEVTVPLQEMVTLPVRELRDLWEDYVALVGLRERLDELETKNAKLQDENLRLQEAVVASERFERLESFVGERTLIPANVIGQDLSPWFKSITLDSGSEAGVRPGMPVITDSGLVGVVSGTTPRFARVLLITDPQSRIDTYVQRTRARGAVHGNADGSCSFQYILREQDLRTGDQLLTSGLGGIYPKGLRLGSVSAVERKPYGLFQSADVEPAVKFEQLEEVFVIPERRELPSEDEFATEDEELWAVGEGQAAPGTVKPGTPPAGATPPAAQPQAPPQSAPRPPAATPETPEERDED
jgi:rod shape-determining protein MreC